MPSYVIQLHRVNSRADFRFLFFAGSLYDIGFC